MKNNICNLQEKTGRNHRKKKKSTNAENHPKSNPII